MNKLLSDHEVEKIAGPGCLVVEYPILAKLNNIEQLFKKSNKIVLLYVHDIDENSITGHYCSLIHHGNSMEFHDSYGLKPDQL